MESKYQEALDRLCENNYFDEKGNCNSDLIVMDRILLQELVDKAKELSNSNDELRRQLYFIEPYKFEDLKPNMWVYDIKVKWLFKIVSVDIGIEALKHYVFIVENRDGSTSLINFEENRFFPVQCANLEIENW